MGNANKEESNKLTIKGVVTNDEPGVIYLSGGNCNMYDGVKICDNTSNNYYGSGGTISNNNATDCVGGGISILGTRSDGYGTATMPSTFVMTGGNIVDNTAANYGGGISITGAYTNVVMDSTNIYENKAQKNGGGVAAIYNKEQKTTIISAQINNNDALSDSGGGIYYDSNSKIYLSGTISVQDNTAYCQSSDIKCTNNLNIISSSDNTTVYLIYIEGSIKCSKIGITDPKLWKDALDDSDNGASSLEYLTSGYNANNPKYPDNNPIQYFTSDHAGVFCGRFRRGCQFSRILL